MKTITTRDLIRGVAEKWRNQYEPFAEVDMIRFSMRHGHTELRSTKMIYEELLALDPETATAEDVNQIIGNDSWTLLKCHECGSKVDSIIVVGEEPDYESSTASLCLSCIEKAYTLMKQIGH